MTVSEMFKCFLDNLVVDNAEIISKRYGEITSSLNKKFRDTLSKKDNSLQVGSYGRWTAIKGVSDLDMLYIMPKEKWNKYKDQKQSLLLEDTKNAILARYPKTTASVDKSVVIVTYADFRIEVQPAFEYSDDDGTYFKYPDTRNGGSWKKTKPRQEIEAMKKMNEIKNRNLRRLCKMARAWKEKNGVVIGGLLIDTLAYNFLKSTTTYDNKSYLYYDKMSRDFFEFLKDQPKHEYYNAPGSNQKVKVKKSFQSKAKKAHEISVKAIEEAGKDSAHNKWKDIYGRPFPDSTEEQKAINQHGIEYSWRNTEEFIQDFYKVDIRYDLKINCKVSQHGFRTMMLREMLAKNIPLLSSKKLFFEIIKNEVPDPYSIKWKVLNRGIVARQRDMIRGQIFHCKKYHEERTLFNGEHVVECYIIKDNTVVARDRIDVPIVTRII